MIRIPNKDKKFTVDNSSLSLGNIYSTWNIMFDADIGKIKLNPPITKTYSASDNADFTAPYAMLPAPADFSTYGSSIDFYILTDDTNGFGGVWKTLGGLAKLTGTGTPSVATNTTSDMCLFLGAQTTPKLYVSDADGLHMCKPTESMDNWGTLLTSAEYKNNFILIPFLDQNRLYMVQSTADKIYSVAETSDGVYAPLTSGSYTLVSGLSGISCGRASSKRIWFATSDVYSGKAKIYEWDGVNPNPLNIFKVDTPSIQSITILNDLPVAIDSRGRFWFYDGYQFVLKKGINLPAREDDVNQTYRIHRNGMMSDKGKIFVLVSSSGSSTPNTSERGLAGVWCYDPDIGVYHFSSPDNCTRIVGPYALSKWTTEQTLAIGHSGRTGALSSSSSNRVSVTDTRIGLTGGLRNGFIVTQFIESQKITDSFNTIAIKYRDMIYDSALIEVKYRTEKNIECNTTITWTSGTTFTCATADLAGTGSLYNSQVVVGDEVMVQEGNNTGLIAHITTMVVAGATTTVTIDKTATTTSGDANALISNFRLLKRITKVSGDIFKNLRLGKAATMVQVKIVMEWKGYYDEIQEILVDSINQDKAI